MMAGSNDLGFLEPFNSNMASFSDDGFKLRGAYGHRWREWFGKDQVLETIDMLAADPTTRRTVISMWDPTYDLFANSKDVPCNTHCYFRVRNRALETTVCCRSNDIIWGAYGANAVHFSFLHQFIAEAAKLDIGPMHQFSNNFHIYERHWELLDIVPEGVDLYNGGVGVVALLNRSEGETPIQFLVDCEAMVTGRLSPKCSFLKRVAVPMLTSYLERKEGKPGYIHHVMDMPPCDWKIAALRWFDRHNQKGAIREE
jgi:hypothetical protein